jgi:hypothetical protein
VTSKHEAIRDANATTELGPDRVISGVRHEYENCALLGCYAASCGNFSPKFRDNLTLTLQGLTGCPKTSVRTRRAQISRTLKFTHANMGCSPEGQVLVPLRVSTLQFAAPNQEHIGSGHTERELSRRTGRHEQSRR